MTPRHPSQASACARKEAWHAQVRLHGPHQLAGDGLQSLVVQYATALSLTSSAS
jgi:hypothetical protein